MAEAAQWQGKTLQEMLTSHDASKQKAKSRRRTKVFSPIEICIAIGLGLRVAINALIAEPTDNISDQPLERHNLYVDTLQKEVEASCKSGH